MISPPCRFRVATLAAAVLSLALVSGAAAQTLDVHSRTDVIGGQGEALKHGFSLVTSVRELRDGRVLIVDERDNSLAVADFAKQTVILRSRIGSGPGEYQRVGRLWPLGDTTVMFDRAEPRAVVLVQDRVLTGRTDDSRFSFLPGVSLGVDAAYANTAAIYAKGSPSMLTDSLLLVRVGANSGARDTIAKLWPDRLDKKKLVRPPSIPASGMYVLGVLASDQALTFSDGWTAIARNRPYRVDWCAPNTMCRNGLPLPFDNSSPTDEAKLEHLKQMERSVGFPPVSTDLSHTLGWPAKTPAFVEPAGLMDGSALFALPDGKLLVRRFAGAGRDSTRYDIIDRSGNLVRRVIVPHRKWIVGFGEKHVYLARSDDDGVQYLERHDWKYLATSLASSNHWVRNDCDA